MKNEIPNRMTQTRIKNGMTEKRWLSSAGFLLFFLACAFGCAAGPIRPPQATGQFTLEVVDSRGRPVPEAKCRVAFVRSDVYGDYDLVEGETDDEGHLRVRGRAYQEAVITVTNAGYYRTFASYQFMRLPTMGTDVQSVVNFPHRCMEIYPSQSKGERVGGKWQPWNPTVQIPLKEKRNPIPMHGMGGTYCRKIMGEPVGFDLEKCAWVAPYGNGEHADVSIGFRHGDFVFSAGEAPNGFILAKRDAWSELETPYEAPEDGYVENLPPPTKFGASQYHIIDTDEYLLIRCRATTNELGKILHAHYAVASYLEYRTAVSPNGEEMLYVDIHVRFNPEDMDRQLEMGENLTDVRKRLKHRGYNP